MITALCYFWYLLWNIEGVDKTSFAVLSTFEIGAEIFLLIPAVLFVWDEWLSRRRLK